MLQTYQCLNYATYLEKKNIELSILNTVLTWQFLTDFIHLPLGLKFILATEGRYQLTFSLLPLPHLKYLDSHTLWLDPQQCWSSTYPIKVNLNRSSWVSLKFKSLSHLHTNWITPSFKSLPFISRSPHLKHKMPSSSDFEEPRISHCHFNVPPHLQKEHLFTRAQCDSLEFARQVRKSPEAEEEY